MKLELKSIQYSSFASQETSCYQAKLYVDGKPFATVGNEGCGGCDYQHSLTKHDKEFMDKLDDINKYLKTLPKIKSRFNFADEGEKVHEFEVDLELWCGEQLEKWQSAKDMKKIMRTKHLCKDEKGFFTYPHEVKVARIIRDNPKALILNDLPFDEALTLYMGEE